MVVLKCLGGLVVGAICGFIAAMVIGIVVWIGGGLIMWDSDKGSKFANGVALVVFYLGIGIGVAVPIVQEIQANKEADEAAERQRRDAEERRQAELQRERNEFERKLLDVRQLCSEAQSTALSLSTTLAQAELALNLAEEQLKKRRYSPFWEAVEDATALLNLFDQRLQFIASRKTLYVERAAALGSRAPIFTLGDLSLPDPGPTHSRLLTLYLSAQESPDFAMVYEQRRTTASVDRTNVILVSGFRSLNDAVNNLGDRIVDTLDHLSASVNLRLDSIQSSLESTAQAAAQQRSALLDEIRRSTHAGGEVLAQLRKDSEDRLKHEQAARRMLDNIQRKRQPTIFE